MATLKVQVNCNAMRGKKKLDPEFKFIKDFCINTRDLHELNKSHLFRVYRDLGYAAEKRKTAMVENRVKIVSIEITQGPCGLEGTWAKQ